MNKYCMSTGLWDTRKQEFSNDKEAWETLRLLLPNKWVTLYVQMHLEVGVNNREITVPKHDKQYPTEAIGDNPLVEHVMVPIMFGATDHAWMYPYENVERPSPDWIK